MQKRKNTLYTYSKIKKRMKKEKFCLIFKIYVFFFMINWGNSGGWTDLNIKKNWI